MKKDPIQKAKSQQKVTLLSYAIALAVVIFGAIGLKTYDCVAHTKELETAKLKLDEQQRYTELYSQMSVIDIALSQYMNKIRVISGFKGYTALTEELTAVASDMKLRMDCSVPVLKEKDKSNTAFMQPVRISGRYEDVIAFYQYMIRKEQIQNINIKKVKVTDSNNLECGLDLMILVYNTTGNNGKKKGA